MSRAGFASQPSFAWASSTFRTSKRVFRDGHLKAARRKLVTRQLASAQWPRGVSSGPQRAVQQAHVEQEVHHIHTLAQGNAHPHCRAPIGTQGIFEYLAPEGVAGVELCHASQCSCSCASSLACLQCEQVRVHVQCSELLLFCTFTSALSRGQFEEYG